MQDWISTTLSVIAGGFLTMASGWLADQRLTKRDRERRQEERRERRIANHNDFQRETLLALQTTSQKLLRNTGASFHQDVMAFREGHSWQRQQLPDELSEGHLLLSTEAMLLSSRVQDDEVRRLAEILQSQTASVGMSSGEQEAQNRMMAAANTQDALIKRIGQLLRDLDRID